MNQVGARSNCYTSLRTCCFRNTAPHIRRKVGVPQSHRRDEVAQLGAAVHEDVEHLQIDGMAGLLILRQHPEGVGDCVCGGISRRVPLPIRPL